jgi:hypothetical protein
MRPNKMKVIGFFAYRSRGRVVCAEPEACIIAGSEDAMKQYIRELDAPHADQYTIRKTRFCEIFDGLALSAAYAFDKESYRRFFPLARQAGLPVLEADFDEARDEPRRFFTLQYRTSCAHHRGEHQ